MLVTKKLPKLPLRARFMMLKHHFFNPASYNHRCLTKLCKVLGQSSHVDGLFEWLESAQVHNVIFDLN